MLLTYLTLCALLASLCSTQSPPPYLHACAVFDPSCPRGSSSSSSLSPKAQTVQVLDGNRLTDGITVAAFSTGNGTNAAILTNDTSEMLTGQFNNSYWVFNGFISTYSLYMEPTADSKVFPGYGYVGINFGFATPGFSEGDEDGLLVWNNTDMANVGSYFGLCPTLFPGYESAGVQNQVFWQSNEAPSEGTVNCTTIIFEGAYESGATD